MNKTEARELISKGFKSLTASSKSYQEKVHLDFIKDHLEKKNFSHVASYMSLPHEVSTKKINKFLADSKNHLYLPKINSKSNKLEFVLCNKKTKFRKNSLNILEPMSEETIPINMNIPIIKEISSDEIVFGVLRLAHKRKVNIQALYANNS